MSPDGSLVKSSSTPTTLGSSPSSSIEFKSTDPRSSLFQTSSAPPAHRDGPGPRWRFADLIAGTTLVTPIRGSEGEALMDEVARHFQTGRWVRISVQDGTIASIEQLAKPTRSQLGSLARARSGTSAQRAGNLVFGPLSPEPGGHCRLRLLSEPRLCPRDHRLRRQPVEGV